jgi:glycerol-3-phosphate dehydrogenase
MAEDCVDHAITLARLPDVACTTKGLKIHGYLQNSDAAGSLENHLAVYGSDADAIRTLAEDPKLSAKLHPALPYIAAEVVWAARAEMARTVEDVLARHTRALFLNAAAARAMADPAARLLAVELGRNEAWIAAQVKEFRALAQQYLVT